MATTSRYNEIFDDTGHVRAPYRAFQARTGSDPLHPRPGRVPALAHHPPVDSYAILGVPLVLDDRDYRETIAAGVRQRALALQALFHDLVDGKLTRSPGGSLPAPVFADILGQHRLDLAALRQWWSGRPREDVRFTYAPDLLRGPDGVWQVLEDNVGCVGGVVDAHLVLSAYLDHTGVSLHAHVPDAPDLTRAAGAFLARVGHTPSSPQAVALVGCEGDAEAQRRRRTLEATGLRVMNGGELRNAVQESSPLPPIAAVVNFDSTEWLTAPGFADETCGRRDVALMTAPGVEVLGNKALLPFADDIVAFYSGAPPILRTARTELYRAMPGDPRGRVLKASNGCQGQQVFFLEALSGSALAQLEAKLSVGGPAQAVLQTRINASVMPIFSNGACEEYQVELRPLAWVIGDSVCVVGEAASGRAFRNDDGFGVGNMSRGASYVAVIREPAEG
jgi:hypothetical protein